MLRSAPILALLLAACAPARPTADDRPTPTRVGTGGTLANPAEGWITSAPPAAQEAGISEALPAAADDVYAVLDDAYAAVGIEVSMVSSRDRTLGNTSLWATRRLGRRLLVEYVSCPDDGLGGSMSSTKPVQISVLSTVTPMGESSRLTTRVRAVTSTSARAGALHCTSTGALEAAIGRAVKHGLLTS